MKSQITEVNVRTLSGATIWTNNNPVLEGVSIPVHLNAESGIYLVEVMTQSGEVFTEKAVIK